MAPKCFEIFLSSRRGISAFAFDVTAKPTLNYSDAGPSIFSRHARGCAARAQNQRVVQRTNPDQPSYLSPHKCVDSIQPAIILLVEAGRHAQELRATSHAKAVVLSLPNAHRRK